MGDPIIEACVSNHYTACLIEKSRGLQEIRIIDTFTGVLMHTIYDPQIHHQHTIQRMFITLAGLILIQSLGRIFVYTMDGKRIATHDFTRTYLDILPLQMSSDGQVLIFPSYNHPDRIVVYDLHKSKVYCIRADLSLIKNASPHGGLVLLFQQDGVLRAEFRAIKS
jgi:hypothetical protein